MYRISLFVYVAEALEVCCTVCSFLVGGWGGGGGVAPEKIFFLWGGKRGEVWKTFD